MSAKWHRSRAWDDRHFPEWAWPAKKVLRALSSIPLAVVLLSGVVLYGVLASVPIGILAQAPTYAIVGAVFAACAAGLGAALGLAGRAVTRGGSRPTRIAFTMLGTMGGVVAGLAGCAALVWPHLKYDWGTGEGFMLFADFCARTKGTTLRRLPGFEMTEAEFYGAWPLRVILLVFVLNMVVATVRRIEFRFVNIGVLTVHSGIVVITLGSVYYGALKREGETLLLAGPPSARGEMSPGPWQSIFYDAQHVSLYARTRGETWVSMPLRGVPRYNDYGLNVKAGRTAWDLSEAAVPGSDRRLSLAVPPAPKGSLLADLRFRVVGYAQHTEERPRTDWLKAEPAPGGAPNPLREVRLAIPSQARDAGHGKDGVSFYFLPERPRERLTELDELGIEYMLGDPHGRLGDLEADIGDGVLHAAVVEVPRAAPLEPVRAVVPLVLADGTRLGAPVPIGDTGYTVALDEVQDRPDLPIITKGYEGAQSSLLKLRVQSPSGESFVRWVYHRFPELAQDLLEGQNAEGRPARRDATPAIRVGYIDASKWQVYVVEDPSSGSVRVISRGPGESRARVTDVGPTGRAADVIGEVGLTLGERWTNAERFERPAITPEADRERDNVGTHRAAMAAIEVTSAMHPDWTRIVWTPFVSFVDIQGEQAAKSLTLPDGREVAICFGRSWHAFPGFAVRLEDFTMVEYAYRGAPRDYQSTVTVAPTAMIDGATTGAFEPFTHTVRLNAPLRAPFNVYDQTRGAVASFVGRLASGMNPRQFKLSQSGWDPKTWNESRARVDKGELDRPFVTHTILHVGNNPGIHIIALGGIMMGVGTPWAFYVKPWLLRRRAKKIRAQIARGAGPARGTEEGRAEA